MGIRILLLIVRIDRPLRIDCVVFE